MFSKNNRKLQERKLQEKQRFGFRKYSFGLASALIGVSFMLGTGSTVSADTNTPSENVAAATTSKADSGTAEADTTKPEADTKSTDVAPSTTDTTKADTNAAEASNTAAPSTTSETTETKRDSVTTNAAEASKTKTSEANSEDKSSVTTNSNASADQSTSSASTAPAKAALARAASTTAATDDSISSEGKITDEGKAKGLTDSDVTPEMSDANGASIVADQSKIPSGYEADPADDRYTFGIVSLGPLTATDGTTTYNGENNTNYYFRFSTGKDATNGQYDDTVYAQLVDGDTRKVIWDGTPTVNGAAVQVDNLKTVISDGSTHYYQLTYSATTTNGVTTKQIKVNSDVGTQYSEIIYDAANSSNTSSGTVVHVMYPDESTIRTEYIAKDAASNETMLADYEQIGRQGYTYTASGARIFKGYDLISAPSNTTGTLSASYKVGNIILSTQKRLSDQLQIARIYVITDTNGTAQVVLKVAALGASIDDIADESIWKTILTSNPVAPGGFADNGNYEANKENPKGAFLLYTLPKDGKQPIGVKYLTDAGFTEDQLTGYEKYLTIYGLNNRLAVGQEPVKYYYAPQGQVRINYVTSDGTVIQAPVSAYENSGANTSYDVTGSTYQPQTITANGKTYRYVKSDKSMGTAGTTEVNGYTYNVTPSDATGRIKSNTVNDVFYVYEQVTYHTEAEHKDVTRTIEYYDSVTGEQIPSDLEKTVTQTAKLNRNKIYDDQNNFVGYGTISADGSSYTINDSWNVDKQTWTQQDSADLSDYGYTAPDRASVAAVRVDGDTTNVTEKVYYGHQTVPVTPEKPGTPGEPINPKGGVKYPDGVSKNDLTSTVTRTINYVDEDGKAVNGSPDGTSSYVQTAEFTRTAIVDKVTGKILGYDTDNNGKVDTESADRAWTPTEKTLAAVKSADPSSVGYDKVDIPNVSSLLVTPDQADTTVTVTYSNNPVIVSGTIKYVDDTTGAELDNDNLPSGEVGSKINYTTADKIKNYEDQGYELVSNDFADGTQTYAKEGNNFVVHLKHKTQTITPNDPNPVTPGEPINPNDPNSPVYGEETDRKNLVKDATQTIHYVGAGDKTPADNVVTQKDAFTRTVTIDKVTGKVLSYTDWTGEKTFNTVDTPVVQGYHADKKTAGGLTATVDNPDVEETVTYSPNGKLVPVDPNGTPIPGADTPTYPTDPNDPTKVVPNEPIPDVPNYTPVDPSPVTPADPGKDTPVPYNQVVTGTIKYVDDTTGKTLSSADLEKGTVGSKINYTTADKIKGYEDNGYEFVSSNFTDGSQVYAKEGNDFVVHLKHSTKEVVSYKDATQTIHYVGAGDKTPADKVQTQKDAFTKTDTIDKVTGEVVKTTGWEGTKTFGFEDTPVVQGYHADKKTAGGLTATPDKPDVEATVTYSPNGKLVPVDPNGTPIPGADTPTYPTDPNDPTKVVPNEPIPDVPNYTPVDPSPVTPADPGKDTPVPYNQVVTGTIKYVDDTTGKTLSSEDFEKGTVGSKINYTTADKIKSYEDKGYQLVSTDFSDGKEVYAKEGNDFVVHLKHSTKEVVSYKDATQTIHYVGAGDKTPADKVQTQKDAFTKTDTIDKVTGEVVKTTGWEGTKTFGTEDTPVVQGYHADKKTAGGLTATPENPDVEATVTYSPNGKLVPVDPNGTPIPGADTPTYPTDPNDPTKVVPNEPIPDVPNWTPVDPSPVTPSNPGEDTPVPYTKNETPAAKYGLIEKFVDENGNELLPSVNKGTDYKTGDSYDVTKDAKVVEGYVLVKTTDVTGTFTDSDKTAVFTYKKIGKIVPVDPSGNPIPGADTPTYKNDPDDPSKVVPNEPTPDVPGYKTDVPKVTPEDPTKDTPVPYTKNETPAAKYGLTEKFVDEDGNELLPSVNKGTDYKTGDSYDVTKDAKVVEGYVLVKTTDTTGTFTDGNKTAVFTYKKIGKIVPVDPSGNPIPGADTPTYKNDPEDPSKVVPNEPTPDVPGYTTDVPNVTPEDPTKDTPVPYTKNTTPSTPEVPSTPETPSTPEVPSTPETPSNPEEPTTPDTPEVPSQPQEPASPSGQNDPQVPSQPAKPATPKQTTLTGKQTPAPSKTVTANQLPQTGADEEKAILLSALGLGLVTLTSLFGLLGGKKRKH